MSSLWSNSVVLSPIVFAADTAKYLFISPSVKSRLRAMIFINFSASNRTFQNWFELYDRLNELLEIIQFIVLFPSRSILSLRIYYLDVLTSHSQRIYTRICELKNRFLFSISCLISCVLSKACSLYGFP